MDARLLIVVWSEGADNLRFFDPETGDEIFYDVISQPPPLPEPGPVNLEAYVFESDVYKDVTDRFEILEGHFEDGILAVKARTLADKMSMQGGELIILPTDLPTIPDMERLGHGTIQAARKDWDPQPCEAHWVLGPNYRYSLRFIIGAEVVRGSATTSAGDHPWNWHYGFEIVVDIQAA